MLTEKNRKNRNIKMRIEMQERRIVDKELRRRGIKGVLERKLKENDPESLVHSNIFEELDVWAKERKKSKMEEEIEGQMGIA